MSNKGPHTVHIPSKEMPIQGGQVVVQTPSGGRAIGTIVPGGVYVPGQGTVKSS